jgi:DNA-binding transcriptional ArsR family regulator
MFRQGLSLRLFVLASLLAITVPQFGILPPTQAQPRSAPTENLETKVAVDSQGAIHILWTVPSLNGSTSAPGLWYAKYEPNGTDSIPPTMIRNSSLVQAADMAVDKSNGVHITWAESTALANGSRNAVSRLYYGEVNSTDPGRFVSIPLTGYDKTVMWPSLAVDRNLTSYMVWTQFDTKAGSPGGAYYGTLSSARMLNRTALIAPYNQSLLSAPRPYLALDPVLGGLHIAWVESSETGGGQVVSTVRYAQVDLRTRNITRLQIATFNAPSNDASVTSGSSGGAYVVWQENAVSGGTRSVYVALVSSTAHIVYVRELAEPNTQTLASHFTVSSDSQDNLYVVWYQPGGVPSQYLSQTSTATSSVAYLKLDRDGTVSEFRNELITGPLIAVTVSSSGDLFALSQPGTVRMLAPINTLNLGVIAAAAVIVSAMAGVFSTEEVRYRILLSSAPVTKRLTRKSRQGNAGKDREVLRALSRRPGVGLHELKDLLSRQKPTMVRLALLERGGYVSSVRIGIARRFYTGRKMQQQSSPDAISVSETVSSRIVHEIESSPGIWEAELSRNLGLSQQIVHYHLKKLQASNILKIESVDKRKHYWLRGSSYPKEGPAS